MDTQDKNLYGQYLPRVKKRNTERYMIAHPASPGVSSQKRACTHHSPFTQNGHKVHIATCSFSPRVCRANGLTQDGRDIAAVCYYIKTPR